MVRPWVLIGAAVVLDIPGEKPRILLAEVQRESRWWAAQECKHAQVLHPPC